MEFYLSTVRANLLLNYLGEDGDGDAFPASDARLAALDAADELSGRTVVFVGRRVAQAFGCKSDWFRWDRVFFKDGSEFRFAVIPHPSGRNRWWNDPKNVDQAEKFLRDLMKVESKIQILRNLRARARSIEEKRVRSTTEEVLRGAGDPGSLS
jgi:hypothetical protein